MVEASVISGNFAPPRVSECSNGCSGTITVLREQAEFLREQVRNLQDKLLCLVPEAAARDHQLRLTHMTNMRPEAASGIVPLENTLPDEDQAIDQFMNDIQSGFRRK